MSLRQFKFMLTLGITFIFPLSLTKAEIPFNQAVDMYRGTKDEYKKYSPFWSMVAVHGKMLPIIRFFGNYSTNVIKERDDLGIESTTIADQARDPIANLLKRLFNSPDGLQFVATTYIGDPVGNLNGLRNLSRFTHLNLNNNSTITDEGIKNLPHLTELTLGFANITDTGLANLPQLTHLDLSYDQRITDKGLHNLPNLQVLTVRPNNTITNNCITQLRERNPNIQIIGR